MFKDVIARGNSNATETYLPALGHKRYMHKSLRNDSVQQLYIVEFCFQIVSWNYFCTYVQYTSTYVKVLPKVSIKHCKTRLYHFTFVNRKPNI